MSWSENSSVANLGWNLDSQFTMQSFGPLALTCGYPFIIQGQPLQLVPFGYFPYELSLSYPTYSMHIHFIPRTPITDTNS